MRTASAGLTLYGQSPTGKSITHVLWGKRLPPRGGGLKMADMAEWERPHVPQERKDWLKRPETMQWS